MKVGLDCGQGDINNRAIDKSQARTENGGNKDPQPRVWVTRTFGTRRSHYGFIARRSHESYGCCLPFSGPPGVPARPSLMWTGETPIVPSCIVPEMRGTEWRSFSEPFRRIQ